MRIKKIIANDMKEGREIIERELGSEAIILSHRNAKLPSGAPVVEFIAALDTNLDDNKNNMLNPQAIYENSTIFSGDRRTSTGMPINIRDNELLIKIASEISNLKELTNFLSENIKYKYTGTMPEPLARVYKILRNSDISEEFALELIGRASSKGLINDYKLILTEVQKRILEKIQFANPIKESPVRQIISFYGATGGGKTTSVIKLAIIYKLLYNSKVLIVSADTHKVGGIEQLQTLASISGIAFSAAYNPEELREIVKKENIYDLILIDTPGCNPNNLEDMSSLLEYHKSAAPDLRLLVLSATNSEKTTINTIDKFVDFGLSSCIVTKVDEAIGLGNIISALSKKSLPISYFTNGTKIPDDLELANSEKLYAYLLVV